MKFDTGTRATGLLKEILHDTLQPGLRAASVGQKIGQLTRRGLAIVLSAVMIMIPMGQDSAFAQSVPPPAADNGQQAPQAQPLSADQLDQLVAPIALYPDAMVAQVLAAATYPTQVVEADRWRQSQGNASAEQIAAGPMPRTGMRASRRSRHFQPFWRRWTRTSSGPLTWAMPTTTSRRT